MFWLIPAILSALFDSLKDIASKKSLKNVEPEVAALAKTAFAVPVVLIALLMFEEPVFDRTFWIIISVSGVILASAFVLYMKALKTTDVSLAIPFTALSPAFMIFITPLILGETTTKVGTVGVLLLAVGAYLINSKQAPKGVLGPLRALAYDKGVRLMIFVAFLWSITASIDRIVLRHASPLFYVTVYYIYISVLLLINALLRRKKSITQQIKSNFSALAGIGIFMGFSLIAYIYAYTLTLAAYVIAVKRTNALFSVVLGAIFFKEKNIRGRLLGAALMVLGVAIISLF